MHELQTLGRKNDVGELVLRCVTASCQYFVEPETCMSNCLCLIMTLLRQLCGLHIRTN
jgi:hypothetical protein